MAVVGRVAREGTYCSPDTGWIRGRKPGQEKEFAFPNIKAKLMLEPPPDPALRICFENSVNFLRTITNANNCFTRADVFCGSNMIIPLSHPFFESRYKTDTRYSNAVIEWITTADKQSAYDSTVYFGFLILLQSFYRHKEPRSGKWDCGQARTQMPPRS